MPESHTEQLVWSGDYARLQTELVNTQAEKAFWHLAAFTLSRRLELIKDMLADDDPKQAMLIVLAALEDYRERNV